MHPTQDVLISEADEYGIVHVTINRAAKGNSITDKMVDTMTEVFVSTNVNPLVRTVILQSAGDKIFCAGGDTQHYSTPASQLVMFHALQRLSKAMTTSPALIITAIQGSAVGGGAEIPLNGDFIILGPRARFKMPEITAGKFPTSRTTTRLPLIVGLSRAKEIMMTSRWVEAEEALTIGLAMELSKDPKSRAVEIARTMSGYSGQAITITKMIVERTVVGDPDELGTVEEEVGRSLYQPETDGWVKVAAGAKAKL